MNAIETKLNAGRLREALGRTSLFRRIVLAEGVGSTNDVLREMASRGASEGTVVLADRQSAGRGRQGRSWHSPGGVGLYVSVLLRPVGPPPQLTRWTLGAAVAACDACRRLTGAGVTIRWPNDLLCEGRKLGGVLAESRSTGERPADLVIGLGLNVGHAASDFPQGLSRLATSLRLESAATPERERLAALYLRRLEEIHRHLAAGEWSTVAGLWERRAPGARGAPVRVVAAEGPGESYDGTTVGLDGTGALRIRREDGSVATVRQAESVVPREG